MSEIEKNVDEFTKNLQLRLKLQNIGLNSWGDMKPKEVNKEFKTLYSAQMVDAYNQDLETPYTDPDTGVEYKYKMLPPPDLEEIDESKLIDINVTPDEIQRDIQLLLKIYNSDSPSIKTKLESEIFYGNKELEKLTMSKNQTDILIKLPQLKAMIKDREIKLSKYKNDIQKEISDLVKLKEDVEQDVASNYEIKKANAKLNQQKIKDYRDSLNQLNRGAISLDQQPYEDEETYLNRIKELVETPYDNISSIGLAKVYNIQKFKDNMKELIRNDVLIDQVLNTIKNSNPDGLFLLNEKFNLIKNDFIKTYGFNNYSLTADKVSKILLNFLDNDILPSKNIALIEDQQNDILQQLSEDQPQSEQLKLNYDSNLFGNDQLYGELIDNNKTYKISNHSNNRSLYFKIAEINKNKTDKSIKLKNYVFVSKIGKPTSYYSLIFKQDNDIPDNNNIKALMIGYLGMTDEDYLKAFPTSSTNKNIKDIKEIINWFTDNKLEFDNNNSNLKSLPIDVNNKIFNTYGMGLTNNEKLPKICSFGKINILLDKLYHKNILSIQTNNGLKIAGFKNTPVSDSFINIIMKLCKGLELSISDFNDIKTTEKDLLNELLIIAGLEKRKILGSGSSNTTIKNLKERLNIIEGEIEAGNNNEVLKNELYDILFKLVHFNVISEVQARKHFKNIKNNYF